MIAQIIAEAPALHGLAYGPVMLSTAIYRTKSLVWG
jgi:hypothetical protein